MSRALDQANKFSYQMVKFTYGDLTGVTWATKYAAYTNWTDDVTGSPDFVSTPALQVTLPENNGTVENAEVRIKLPLDTFSERASSGLPHSPIYVEIWDKTVPAVGGDSSSTLKVFSGRVQAAIRNPNGKRAIVELTAASYKLALENPMGVSATHQCQWTYGEGPCQMVQGKQSITLTAIDGKKITTTGVNYTSPALPDRYFHRGYIVYDGCYIGIREWRLADPNTFYLVRQPPALWLTKGIQAFEGCDKTIEACRTRHSVSGEQYFMGCGYAIPSYNPLHELGG